MVRPNSVIPFGYSEEGPEYDYGENITFRVYEITDRATAVVYDREGKKCAELIAVRQGEELQLEVHAPKGCTIELWNLSVKEVQGASVTAEENRTILEPAADKILCRTDRPVRG